MQLPIRITFRGMPPSPTLESQIRERASRLERFHDRIIGCRVVIESPHRHHHKGRMFTVRVDVTVPGGEFVASSNGQNHAYEDVHVAIRDAFDAMTRRLEDHARRNREPIAETVSRTG